jgi:hypothetical protein
MACSDGLPIGVQRKAVDYMRVGHASTPAARAAAVDGFLDSLTTEEFEQYKNWFRSLPARDQDAILVGKLR